MFGAAVSSSSPAVAARCAFARTSVGAACSQNVTDPRLGPRLLDLLAGGLDADAGAGGGRRRGAARRAPPADRRRRAAAAAAAYSGAGTLGTHATHVAPDCVAAGNLLASTDVPPAMAEAFARDPEAHLGDRLVAALRAALDAGGEEGPVRSCGMVLVRDVEWYVADLRVDWSEGDPIADLERLWEVYAPQLDAYVTRALDPTAAPSYGVPGDE